MAMTRQAMGDRAFVKPCVRGRAKGRLFINALLQTSLHALCIRALSLVRCSNTRQMLRDFHCQFSPIILIRKTSMKIQTLFTAVVLAAGVSAAFAQASATPKDPLATPRIDHRQANQEKRIDQGVASGSLTKREAAKLDKREVKIESDKLVAKSDGQITPAERHKLNHEQNEASRAIARDKHNHKTAAPAAPAAPAVPVAPTAALVAAPAK